MDTRQSLLQAAVEVFADLGWRGTTTRRIAERAGVNEVTLFRHFGTKELLIEAAVASVARQDLPPRLPEEPGDLRTELLGWGLGMHTHATHHAKMIRTSLAEFEEHPDLAPVTCDGAIQAMDDVVQYLTRARARGLIATEGSLEAATVMLMNTIVLDGITRDIIPRRVPVTALEAVDGFVDLILRALGATAVAS